MDFFIISNLGVCPSGDEVMGELIIICWGDNFQFLYFTNFALLPVECCGKSELNKGKYFRSAAVELFLRQSIRRST